MTATQEKKIAD